VLPYLQADSHLKHSLRSRLVVHGGGRSTLHPNSVNLSTRSGIWPTVAPTRAFFVRVLLPAAATALLGACDMPSGIPQLEQTWVIPIETTTLAVDELLPPEITVVAGAFRFVPTPVPVTTSLGALCSACVNGATAPKPAFTSTVTANVGTGTDLLGVTTTAGTNFRVTLAHTMNFDPIRPSSTARGFVILELRTGGVLLGRDSVSGNTTAWPSSTPLSRDIPIAAGVSIASGTPIRVDVTINSPLGDPVTMNTSQTMTVTGAAAGTSIGITSVRVRVANKTVRAANLPLDLGGVSDDVFSNIVSGAMLMTITNPFSTSGLSGTLTMTIAIPGDASITKTVAVPATATSTATIDFSGAELERMLGKDNITLTMTGTVNAPAAGVTVVPGQAFGFANSIRMTIRTGN
jgi:hypothetical protein